MTESNSNRIIELNIEIENFIMSKYDTKNNATIVETRLSIIKKPCFFKNEKP